MAATLMVSATRGATPAERHAAHVVPRQRREELRHDARVARSKPAASLIKVGSLNAVPMKLIPTGRPNTFPIGTLMIG